jgi:hypothetical protein
VLEGLPPGAQVVVHSEKDISASSRIQVVAALVESRP